MRDYLEGCHSQSKILQVTCKTLLSEWLLASESGMYRFYEKKRKKKLFTIHFVITQKFRRFWLYLAFFKAKYSTIILPKSEVIEIKKKSN